ncbi:hypothetical protein ANRL4_04029 [Anaerolineae bacterium]|nr:hypothetical protein ANRL4_04029 [Anaerolineae bacterium]
MMDAPTRWMVRSNEMSPKEQETLILLTQGLTPGEIADLLQVTPNYIYALIRLLKARFNARTAAGVVACALREGILEAVDSAWEE